MVVFKDFFLVNLVLIRFCSLGFFFKVNKIGVVRLFLDKLFFVGFFSCFDVCVKFKILFIIWKVRFKCIL